MYDAEKYVRLIKENLSPYRFHHSMCVAERAKEMALKYGADSEKAYTAGILHDITKEMPIQEQFEQIKRAGWEISHAEKNNHRVLHQKSGAAFVINELGVKDDEIIGGIRFHTTGKADMTLFEMLIYLADFTSEDRSYPDVETMRRETDRSLLDGMLYSLKFTVCDIVSHNRQIHPDTIECYNWVLEESEKR